MCESRTSRLQVVTTSNKKLLVTRCIAASNKGITASNKKLLVTSLSLVLSGKGYWWPFLQYQYNRIHTSGVDFFVTDWFPQHGNGMSFLQGASLCLRWPPKYRQTWVRCGSVFCRPCDRVPLDSFQTTSA